MKLTPPRLPATLSSLFGWHSDLARGVQEAAPSGAFVLFSTAAGVPTGWIAAGTSLPLGPYKELAANLGLSSDPFTVPSPTAVATFTWAVKT